MLGFINVLCSVPEEFKNVSTRLKKLQWKDVKVPFICSLHFEANLFKGKSQYRVGFSKAIADLNASEFQTPTDPSRSGPAQAGPAPSQAGPAPPQAGPAPPQAGPAPSQSGPASPQNGPAPPQPGPAPPQPGPAPPQPGPAPPQPGPSPPHAGQNNNAATTTNNAATNATTNNNICPFSNNDLSIALRQIETLKKKMKIYAKNMNQPLEKMKGTGNKEII